MEEKCTSRDGYGKKNTEKLKLPDMVNSPDMTHRIRKTY